MDCKTCLWYDSKATKIHDASVECLLCIHCKLPRLLRNNYIADMFNFRDFIDKSNENEEPKEEQALPDAKFDY